MCVSACVCVFLHVCVCFCMCVCVFLHVCEGVLPVFSSWVCWGRESNLRAPTLISLSTLSDPMSRGLGSFSHTMTGRTLRRTHVSGARSHARARTHTHTGIHTHTQVCRHTGMRKHVDTQTSMRTHTHTDRHTHRRIHSTACETGSH